MSKAEEVALVAGKLTRAQREAILAARQHGDGETSFMAVAFTDPWSAPVAEFFTLTTDRLTPLGLAVRKHLLKGQS